MGFWSWLTGKKPPAPETHGYVPRHANTEWEPVSRPAAIRAASSIPRLAPHRLHPTLTAADVLAHEDFVAYAARHHDLNADLVDHTTHARIHTA